MKQKQTKKDIQKSNPPIHVKPVIIEDGKKTYFNLFAIISVLVLGIIIYLNSFNCSFHFDDYDNIINNKNLPGLTNFTSWLKFNQSRLVAYYSFALNLHFNQLDVWGYHLVNLIIHLINSTIVWWMTMMIFSTPVLKDHPLAKHKKALALFTALLFVAHPLATQSVTYIIQRMASMVAMFYLLSIALYMKGRLINSNKRIKYLFFSASFIALVLALFTKENAFTLPFAILLFEIFFFRTTNFSLNFKNPRLIILISGIIGFIIFITLKFSFDVLKPIPPNVSHPYTITSFNYLLTQFSVIVKYIQLLFFPINQMLDYDFPLASSFLEMKTLLSFILLFGLFISAIKLFNKNRIISFGIFWFFLTLSIESSFIPIDDVIYEHRTYLPSFGFFLILVCSIYLLPINKVKYAIPSILIILVGAYSILTFQRNKIWKDDITLWNDNISKAPGKARPVTNRGFGYMKLGQWDKALKDYSKALELDPNYPAALCNRGSVYVHFQQMDKAIVDLTKAINIIPNYEIAYFNRGVAYSHLQQWEKAIVDYTKAIEIRPNYVKAFSNRGIANGALHQRDKAFADFSKAIEMDPKNPEAYLNRGIDFANQNELDKAIVDYTHAIRLDPKYAEAYYNLGIVYGKNKEWDKAINNYSLAIHADQKYKEAFINRGNAYGNQGSWDKAVIDFSTAIGIDPNFAIAYLNRGIAYGNLSQWLKAIEDYTRAININVNYSKAYLNRGLAEEKLGQWRKAVDDYSRVLQIDPNFKVAYNYREIAIKKL